MADPLEWTPLPEDADERAIFDRSASLYGGDVRLQIADALRSFAATHPRGSYAAMCRIMANEVAKLELPNGVRVLDDSRTAQQIAAPNISPMPEICEGMSRAELWAYATLCGWRAASSGVEGRKP